MTISNFSEKINLLRTLDENQCSIDYDKQGNLKSIEKRSLLANFIHWFIHLITCTYVPRNARLDEVTQKILKEADEVYKSLGDNERKKLTNALTKLETINEHNGGAGCANIKTLAAKIQGLEPIKITTNSISNRGKVNEQEVVPEIPESSISDETRLQNLLRDLKARNLSNTEIAKEVGTLLLEIKNSIALSPEETHTLCRGLRNLKDEWIAENAKKLSPEITLFILEKSFQGEGHIITKIFEALIIEPSNKENLAAWVHAFPLFKPEFLPRGSYNERLENREFINNQLGLRQNEWIRVSDELIKNGKLTGKILEDNLSQDDVKIFLRNFFGFEAYLEKHFDWALELTDQLNEENRLFLLNILCYARHTDSLVKVLHKSLPEDNLMQRIIELNPLENEDIFFKKFISDLFRNESKIPEILPKIKKHLFDNLAHDDRKEQLVSWLSQNVKIDIVENIPLDILEKFYDFSLFNLMQSATQIPEEEKRNSILRLLVYAMYWLNPRLDELINSKLDLCVVLLSFLPSKAQAYLISRALKEISENANSDLCQQKFASFMVEARKLPQEIWDQANKEASF